MVALSLPPNNQAVILAATNEDRQKIQSRYERRKRVGSIKMANLRVNVGKRPMTHPSLLVFLPRQVAYEQLAGRMLAADAKLQLTLQSKFDGVQCHERDVA